MRKYSPRKVFHVFWELKRDLDSEMPADFYVSLFLKELVITFSEQARCDQLVQAQTDQEEKQVLSPCIINGSIWG